MEKPISIAKLSSPRHLMPALVLSLAAGVICLGIFGAGTEALPFQMQRKPGLSPTAANRFQSKLMDLSATGPGNGGSLSPVVFTDDEVNSLIKYDRPPFLPPSVKDLNIHFQPDGIHGAADVNFDELKPSQQAGNQLGARLLASIFRGTQRVTALGVVESKDGTGTLAIKDVHIGSTTLSDWLVNWVIQTYVESEYKIDLSKPFLLPNHVTHIEFAPGKAIFVRGAGRKK